MAASSARVTVGYMYAMYVQLAKYYEAEAMVMGKTMALGTDTEAKDKAEKYAVAVVRADELRRAYDVLSNNSLFIHRCVSMSEDLSSGPIRKFLLDRITAVSKDRSSIRDMIDSSKAIHDSSCAALDKEVDSVKSQAYAEIILDHVYLLRKQQKLNCEIDALRAALKWYSTVHTFCGVGRIPI